MGPMPIVVIDERGDSPLKMSLIQDQQPIEALRSSGPHKPLGHTVRLRNAKRRPDDLHANAPKHVIEAVGKLLVAVANHEPERRLDFGYIPRHLSCLLRRPCGRRVRRTSGEMDATASQLDEEHHIKAL